MTVEVESRFIEVQHEAFCSILKDPQMEKSFVSAVSQLPEPLYLGMIQLY